MNPLIEELEKRFVGETKSKVMPDKFDPNRFYLWHDVDVTSAYLAVLAEDINRQISRVSNGDSTQIECDAFTSETQLVVFKDKSNRRVARLEVASSHGEKVTISAVVEGKSNLGLSFAIVALASMRQEQIDILAGTYKNVALLLDIGLPDKSAKKMSVIRYLLKVAEQGVFDLETGRSSSFQTPIEHENVGGTSCIVVSTTNPNPRYVIKA